MTSYLLQEVTLLSSAKFLQTLYLSGIEILASSKELREKRKALRSVELATNQPIDIGALVENWQE